VIASAKQLVNRRRAGRHLLGGHRDVGDPSGTADEPPLARGGPVSGQHVSGAVSTCRVAERHHHLVTAVDTGLTAAHTRRQIRFIPPPAERGLTCIYGALVPTKMRERTGRTSVVIPKSCQQG
jgi:hypothetical protein